MEYREAKAVGDTGERRVADRLRAYCAQNPPSVFLSDVMVRSGRMTAQLDHVLIDPHGILIVEVKVRNGRIRGTADEKRWTAVYGGMTKTFQNPIEQLRGQRNTLSKSLHGVSDPLDLDLIQGLVVFVDADISYLELDSDSRKRVTSLDRLPSVLRERATLRVGGLSHSEVSRRYEQLRLLDQSADPSVQASHAKYRGGAAPIAPARVQATTASTPRPTVTFSGNPNRPAPRAEPRPPVGLRVGGAFHPKSRFVRKLQSLVIYLVLLGVFWICIVTGVYQRAVTAVLKPLLFPSAVSTLAAAPTVAQAKAQLLQVAPRVYAVAMNIDSPAILSSGDSTTFAWKYIEDLAPDKASIRTYSITLGPGGVLRSVAPGQ